MADDFVTKRKQHMDESDIRDFANDCDLDQLSDLLIALNAIFDTRKRYTPKRRIRKKNGGKDVQAQASLLDRT